MALVLEIYAGNIWREIGKLFPGDRPGSLSNNLSGRREIYMFDCPNNLQSLIYKSKQGTAIEIANVRVVDLNLFERIKELNPKDPLYEIMIKTNLSPEQRKMRFRYM